MVRKLFALVSVAVFSGLVAAAGASGCSANEVSGPSTQPVTDARVDRRIVDNTDASNTVACMTTQAIAYTRAPYKAPVVSPGACPDTVFAFIKKYINDTAS